MGFEFDFIDQESKFVANNRIEAIDGKDGKTLVWSKADKAKAIAWRNANKDAGGRLSYGKRVQVSLAGIAPKPIESNGVNKTLYRKVRIYHQDEAGEKHIVSVNMWERNFQNLLKDYDDVDGILDAVEEQGLKLVATVSPDKLKDGTKVVSCWVSHLTPSGGIMEAAGFEDDDYNILEEAGLVEEGAK